MNPPAPLKKRSFIVTLGLLTGLAAFTVDVSLPAVPAMADALATSLSRGQQIVGIFMIGMAFGQIPAGLVSDRIGRLPVLYVGLTLFIVGGIADVWGAPFALGLHAAVGLVSIGLVSLMMPALRRRILPGQAASDD